MFVVKCVDALIPATVLLIAKHCGFGHPDKYIETTPKSATNATARYLVINVWPSYSHLLRLQDQTINTIQESAISCHIRNAGVLKQF